MFVDKEINLNLEKQFTSIKHEIQNLIEKENLENANIVCWVPHEVGSLVQIGWEDGVVEDLERFLNDTVPPGRWMKHDEPGTPFRHNSFEHIRTKLVGTVSMTLIVKNGELYMGQYQDLYFYSPVYKEKPNPKIFCRILRF